MSLICVRSMVQTVRYVIVISFGAETAPRERESHREAQRLESGQRRQRVIPPSPCKGLLKWQAIASNDKQLHVL